MYNGKMRPSHADVAKGVNLCYLCEGSGPALDGELSVAQLTVAGVRGGQPLLQAALVDRAQSACAVTR